MDSNSLGLLPISRRSGFRQGTVVTCDFSDAVAPELAGQHKGIILSTDGYNFSGAQKAVVCPFFIGQSPFSDGNDYKISTTKNTLFLRPDLTRPVSYNHISPSLYSTTGKPIILPREQVRDVARQFINIISPTPEKLKEPSNGFLAYGQAGWFDSYPRIQEPSIGDCAPVVCLSPLRFRQAGTALVARSFSHLERYDPQKDIAVTLAGFLPNFISVTDFQPLSMQKLSGNQRNGCPRMGLRPLKGFMKKIEALVDDEAFKIAHDRYSRQIGLPPYIQQAVRQGGHGGRKYGTSGYRAG